MIADDLPMCGQDLAFCRVFNFRFQRRQTGPPRLVEKIIEHLERLQVPRAIEPGRPHNPSQSTHDFAQDVRRIGDYQRPNRRPADNHEFGGLHQNEEVTFFHQVAAHYSTEDNNNANKGKHDYVLSETGLEGSPSAACSASSLRLRRDSGVSLGLTMAPPAETVTWMSSPHQRTADAATTCRSFAITRSRAGDVQFDSTTVKTSFEPLPIMSLLRRLRISVAPTTSRAFAPARAPCMAWKVPKSSTAILRTPKGMRSSLKSSRQAARYARTESSLQIVRESFSSCWAASA